MQVPEVCQDAAHTPGWTLTYPHMCINISITMPGRRCYFGDVSEAVARGQSPALNLLGIAWEEFLKTPTAPDQLLIKLKKKKKIGQSFNMTHCCLIPEHSCTS